MVNQNISSANESISREDHLISIIDALTHQESWWWLEYVITIAGIIIGALIVVWQMGRQHRSALKLQQENARDALRLRIFNDIEQHIKSVTDAVVSVGGYALNIPCNLKAYKEQRKLGLNPAPIKERTLSFINLHSAMDKTITRLFSTFESYEIVNPNFKIFQTALNTAIDDARQAFLPLYEKLLKFLPMDLPKHKTQITDLEVIIPAIPDDEQLHHIKDLVNKYFKAVFKIEAYIYDLKVEMQNIFLGSLFKYRVPPRKPTDPSYKVITTEPDRIKELEKYFEEETEWGKNKKRVGQDVRDNIRNAT